MNSRTISYFLTPDDEHKLSSLILARFPNAKFLDIFSYAEAQKQSDAFRDSISDCRAMCYIWDPESVPDFLSGMKPTHHVAHFSRCRTTEDNELYLGQTGMCVNPDDFRQKQFCHVVLRLIRKLKSGPIDAYNLDDDSLLSTGITNFVVGPDAYARMNEDLTLTYGSCYYKKSADIAT